MKTCTIRENLKHYGIPYGKTGRDKFIPKNLVNTEFKYKWDKLKTFFYILIDGMWEMADSDDFVFEKVTKAFIKENQPYVLSIKEALDLLSTFVEKRKKRVHTYSNAGFGGMGCNVDLSEIKKRIQASYEVGQLAKDDYIRLAGNNMKGIGHCVGFYDLKYKNWLFLETDPKKSAAIYAKRKLSE